MWLGISKISPEAGWSIDNAVGGIIGNVKAGIEASPTWQQYDVWFALAFGCVVTGLVMWQGHNAYNKFRGTMVQSAVRETGYQTVPSTQPAIIPQTQTVSQPVATPQQVVTTQPTVQTKEESSK